VYELVILMQSGKKFIKNKQNSLTVFEKKMKKDRKIFYTLKKLKKAKENKFL